MKVCHTWPVLLIVAFGCNSSPESDFNFANPGREYCPHVRMWIPQAATDETTLRSQIADLSEAGFGDVELVAFDSRVGVPDYGWGTENWNKTMQVVLDEAGKNGMTATFTIGPAWPIASPLLKTDSDGVEIQLGCDRTDVSPEGYSGALPPDCFAIVAARKNAEGNLEWDSLQDITAFVFEGSDGERLLNWSPPASQDGWVLCFYRNEKVGEIKGGFPVIDHFSMAGTQAVIDYYRPVFNELHKIGLLEYLAGLFGDSLEYRAQVDWTPEFVETFKNLKGYDITPYLPAVNNGVVIGSSGPYGGIFGGGFGKETFAGRGDKILADYYSVLTWLFNHNHLEPLQKFLEEHGANLRYQTAYGKYMEQASTSMFPGIPEGEMMMIRNSFDNIRAQSGAVHMTDRKEYNAELQAEMGKNHAQSWNNLLFFVQRAFSAGVNNITLHGYNYNGTFTGEGNANGFVPGVSWQGWEGFGRDGFSNSWGTEPLWEMAPAVTGFIARNGYILKQGTAKMDLAVFRESFWDNASFSVKDGDVWYKDGGLLQDMGYTFDFVSLSNLQFDGVEVKDARLCPDGPSYKALLVDVSLNLRNEAAANGDRHLGLQAAKEILKLARAGLPVFLIGEAPSKSTFYSDGFDADAELVGTMAKLMVLPNVHQVASHNEVPETLESSGIFPTASFHQDDSDNKLVGFHRQDGDIDYFYIYNRGSNVNSGMQYGWGYGTPVETPYGSTSVPVTFRVQGKPYLLDAWSGEELSFSDADRQKGETTLTVALAGNSSTIIAFDRGNILKKHAVKVRKAVGSVVKSIEISDWKLDVASWNPGEIPTETRFCSVSLELSRLKPWREIPGLEDVSGIGTYLGEFTLDEWNPSMGAIVDLGTVNFAYRLKLNGKDVPVSLTDTRTDISAYLWTGNNTLVVEVATTLNNRIKVLSENSRRTSDSYGLLGKDGKVIVEIYKNP